MRYEILRLLLKGYARGALGVLSGIEMLLQGYDFCTDEFGCPAWSNL